MPKTFDNIIQFKNYIHSLKIPFVAYKDFECMLQNIHTCQPSDETAYTNAYQKHTPTNFAYYIKYCNGDFKPLVQYSGQDAPKVFYEKLKEDEFYIAKEYYDKIIPIEPLTENEQIIFETQKECHICEKSFDALPPMLEKEILITKKVFQYYKYLGNEKSLKNKYSKNLEKIENNIKTDTEKVADHDHLTGKFRGAAHSVCNLNYKNPRFIPILFHNLAGYDDHLFIEQFGEDNEGIKLIPNTEEKYISFSKVLKYDFGKVNDEGQPIINKTIEVHRFLQVFAKFDR